MKTESKYNLVSMRCEKHQLPMGTSYCNLCAVEFERKENEWLRDALKGLREAAAHVLANEPRDGIVGGPWLRSAYRDSEELEPVLGKHND